MKTKTLLAILCVCFSINIYSQEGEIIYTDFEPDSVIVPLYFCPYNEISGFNPHTNQIPFDIDYDGNQDIGFSYMDYYSGFICYIVSEYNISKPHSWFMNVMELNDTISNFKFEIGHWCTFLVSSNPNPHENYIEEIGINIGIKHVLDDTNSCYGWVRFQFKQEWGQPSIITIYDMAYCTVPNYPLRVGQKSFDDTLINDTSEFKDYVLFPSPANDKITLKFNNHYYNTTNNEIKIYGIDGRLLKTQNSDFDNIDISNLSSGVYIMKIYLGNGKIFTEKFVKE